MAKDIVLLVARICIVVVFLKAGFDKIFNYPDTLAYMQNYHIPLTQILLIITIFIEITCSFLLILGFKSKYNAIILIVFLLVVTSVFHNVLKTPNQMIHLLKNISIIGGLLFIMIVGPGKLSLDRQKIDDLI